MTDDDRLEASDGVETGDGDPDRDGIDRTGPLSDLAATVADRDGGTDDSSPGIDELFEREDVTDVDSERLWQRLENDEPVAEPARAKEREVREIEKGGYCHQCEHFAAPPTVACTLEGTDILEVTSFERFRVADCPVVLEDEALERRE